MTSGVAPQPPEGPAGTILRGRTVVGREAELAAIERLLRTRGDPTTVLVMEGEPGIGKSTVWRAGVELARTGGWRVLVARPAEIEASHAYAALGDLLADVPAAAIAGLPEVQRRAIDVALLRADRAGAPLDLRTVAVGVLGILADLRATAPTLVAIDDSQWLDRASADVLRFVVRRLPATGVAVLTARRPSESGSGAPAPFEAAIDADRRAVLPIGPLSIAALHQLLKDRVGRSFTRPVLVRIDALAQGNPFYAIEIGLALADVPHLPTAAPLPLPGSLSEILEAQIRRLPEATGRAILLVAAAAAPRIAGLEAAWSDLIPSPSAPPFRDALAAAEAAGVLGVGRTGEIRFAHPLLAAAAYAEASTDDRHAVHGVLAARAEDLEGRARHLALGSSAPDEEVAEALAEASAVARQRGATSAAAELSELAVARTPAAFAEARDRRRVELARHLRDLGDHAGSQRVLEDVVATTAATDVRARAYQVLAGIAEFTVGIEQAMRFADLALENAVDDPRLRAALLAHASRTFDGDIPRKVAYADAALAAAAALGPGDLVVADALMANAEASLMAGEGFDAAVLDRAEAIERDAGREIRESREAVYLRAWLEVHSEQLAAAEQDFRAIAEYTEAAGLELRNGRSHVGLAAVAIRRGDLDTAERHVRVVDEVDRRTGSSLNWSLIADATIAAHRGQLDRARRLAAEAIERSRPRMAQRAEALVAAGLIELIAGNAEAAVRSYDAAAAIDAQTGNREFGCGHYEPDRIEALVGAGEHDRAAALLEAFEAHGRRFDRPWILGTALRCRALLAVAAGDLEAAHDALEAALEQHRRLPMRIVEARTLLALGMVERRRRRYRTARAAFGGARDLAAAAGAGAWLAKAEAELDRTHLREAPQGLTPTEAQVAALAAAGHKNREIAARLYVSPKTVEANLARAYRKLGVGSRAELGAAIGRQS